MVISLQALTITILSIFIIGIFFGLIIGLIGDKIDQKFFSINNNDLSSDDLKRILSWYDNGYTNLNIDKTIYDKLQNTKILKHTGLSNIIKSIDLRHISIIFVFLFIVINIFISILIK